MNASAPPISARARLFRGLADPSRLSILETLRAGPRNVAEVVAETGLTQPGVSNHLACLLECGLVVREPRGRYAYYALSDERVEALLEVAELLLEGPAAGLLDCTRCAAREAAEAPGVQPGSPA